MQITDLKGLHYDFGSTDASDTVGIVMKTAEDCGGPFLGLVIPKFMAGYKFNDKDKAADKSVSISSSKCINSSDIKSINENSVTIKNYITVHPLLNQNQPMPIYTIGDKVFIHVFDNDIKSMGFLPYSVNRLGQRATDKTMLVVPANKNENTELTEDNTYFLKLDSKEQVVVLTTNMENGELCKHTVTLNSKDGFVTITDGERIWEMNHKDDKITSTTSGSTITQTGDQIDMQGDSLKIKMDSSVEIETDSYSLKASNIKEEADNASHKFDTYKLESDNGTWEVEKESHSGSRYHIKETTYHNDTPTIGLNGLVILPSFQIGNVPNIDIIPPALVGTSGPKGSMILATDPAAVPLVKYPQLMSLLAIIAAAADTPPSGMGTAAAAVASMGSLLATTKSKSS